MHFWMWENYIYIKYYNIFKYLLLYWFENNANFLQKCWNFKHCMLYLRHLERTNTFLNLCGTDETNNFVSLLMFTTSFNKTWGWYLFDIEQYNLIYIHLSTKYILLSTLKIDCPSHRSYQLQIDPQSQYFMTHAVIPPHARMWSGLGSHKYCVRNHNQSEFICSGSQLYPEDNVSV